MIKKSAIAISLIMALSSMATLAAKPEWAGKGKPNIENIQSVSDAQKMTSELDSREKEVEILIEQNKKKAKKSKNKKEKQKFEEENKELERESKALQEHKEELQEKQKDLEKQKQKKAEQERNELNKGSEKGQEMREEHSKKWWKFWS